jgi:hypothetical protein
VPWFWGSGHSVVIAPGISAFKEGLEYDHGGLTLQEVMVPNIVVMPRAEAAYEPVTFTSCKWKGLRLQVALQNAVPGCRIDIRIRAYDIVSSILSESQKNKEIGEDGSVSLVVENDSYLGQPAVLVALVGEKVVAKKALIIGEE